MGLALWRRALRHQGEPAEVMLTTDSLSSGGQLLLALVTADMLLIGVLVV
jgi:hypothetical protein